MKALRIPLRILFYREDQDWIAHCLDFDLCGDGKTKQEAVSSLFTAIQIQVEDFLKHKNPQNLFSPADSELFRMFAEGSDIAKGELNLSFEPIDSVFIEPSDVREYSDENELVSA